MDDIIFGGGRLLSSSAILTGRFPPRYRVFAGGDFPDIVWIISAPPAGGVRHPDRNSASF
jgi:hypothetical protein